MRRVSIAAALAGALVLSGCALAAGFAYGGPHRETGAAKQNHRAEQATLLPSERDAVEAAIGAKLRDPASARFDGMSAKRTDRGVLVCGFVNAKNSSGRYTGRAPFVGALSGNDFEVFEMSIYEKRRVVGLCDALGVPIDHRENRVIGKRHRHLHHS
jgi:hypothetical protein